MPTPESKTCKKCGQAKPLESFNKRQAKCRPCESVHQKAYREANKEQKQAADRAYYAKNREERQAYYARWRDENRERKAASDKAWVEANKERKRATDAAYRAANKERIAEYLREWHKANPRAKIEYKARRRARRAEVEVQPYTRTEIFERDGGRCRGCAKGLENKSHGFEIDHIVPISLGGPDIPANVQLMCRSCNRRKATRLEGQIHLAL